MSTCIQHNYDIQFLISKALVSVWAILTLKKSSYIQYSFKVILKGSNIHSLRFSIFIIHLGYIQNKDESVMSISNVDYKYQHIKYKNEMGIFLAKN